MDVCKGKPPYDTNPLLTHDETQNTNVMGGPYAKKKPPGHDKSHDVNCEWGLSYCDILSPMYYLTMVLQSGYYSWSVLLVVVSARWTVRVQHWAPANGQPFNQINLIQARWMHKKRSLCPLSPIAISRNQKYKCIMCICTIMYKSVQKYKKPTSIQSQVGVLSLPILLEEQRTEVWPGNTMSLMETTNPNYQ